MTDRGYVGTERMGAEAVERAVYYGPVTLVSYEYREGHGHIYAVDDAKKLPEKAMDTGPGGIRASRVPVSRVYIQAADSGRAGASILVGGGVASVDDPRGEDLRIVALRDTTVARRPEKTLVERISVTDVANPHRRLR